MGLTGGQKVCLGLIALGALAIIVGGAAPYWLNYEVSLLESSYGMWFYCLRAMTPTGSETRECARYPWEESDFGDFTLYFYGVHAGSGVATLLSVVLVFAALVKMCGQSDKASGVGVAALIAGILGIGASVTFYLRAESSFNLPPLLTLLLDKAWAFYVFASGSVLIALFSVILLALPNNPNTVQPF